MLGLTYKGFVKPNVKVLLVPVLMNLILIILFAFSIQNIYSRAILERKKLTEQEKRIEVLKTKLDLLKEVQDKVLEESNSAVVAIPKSDIALLKMYQISLLAKKYGVTVTEKTASSLEPAEGDKAVLGVFRFTVTGDFGNTLSFLENLEKVAPISVLNDISIDKQEELVSMKANISSFWSPLPKQIPSLTEPINRLSNQEQEILTKISTLENPTFSETGLSPSGPYTREDPFN